MIFSPAYYLEANRPYFPPALVPEVALAHIRPIADLLPPASNIAIECRLQAGADNVDFIPQFVRRGGSDAKLAQYRVEDPIWAQISRFCAQWSQQTSALHKWIHAIWLEFDLTGEGAELPPPSIFLGFEGVESLTDYQRLVENAILLLQADLLSGPFQQNLEACFIALPAPANLFSIGLMLARGYDRTRICVGRVPPDKVTDYLRQIGWPGMYQELEKTTSVLSPLVDEFGLALDVGNTVYPKLGLECYLHEASPMKESRWVQLLDYFVTIGQCTPIKKEALLQWPGRQFHGISSTEAAELRTSSSMLPPRLQNLLTRKVSHLKLVMEPNQQAETKAYLELNHAWFPFGIER